MEMEGKAESCESYVVVHNIAKRHNVGTLARSATAFGVSELILVGRRDFNCFGSHGSSSHLRFRHFHSLHDARNFLKDKGCDICGVEITNDALPVNHHPFKKSTAFLLGNEVVTSLSLFHQFQFPPLLFNVFLIYLQGQGLSPKEIQICDFFVYIPQYGAGTASLNVTVAASIVLHHFAGFFYYLILLEISPSFAAYANLISSASTSWKFEIILD